MKNDILIVDDEAAIRDVVAAILEDEGYGARQAANGEQAMQEIGRRAPSLALRPRVARGAPRRAGRGWP